MEAESIEPTPTMTRLMRMGIHQRDVDASGFRPPRFQSVHIPVSTTAMTDNRQISLQCNTPMHTSVERYGYACCRKPRNGPCIMMVNFTVNLLSCACVSNTACPEISPPLLEQPGSIHVQMPSSGKENGVWHFVDRIVGADSWRYRALGSL